MTDVAAALRADASPERITQDAGALPPAASPVVRPRRVWPIVAVAVVLLAAGTLALTHRSSSAPNPRPEPAVEATRAPEPAPAPIIEPNPAPEPAPKPGPVLDVHTRPDGADVLVNGSRRGTTPTRIHVTLPATIILRRRGYRTMRLDVTDGSPIDVELVRSRKRHHHQPPQPHEETLD